MEIRNINDGLSANELTDAIQILGKMVRGEKIHGGKRPGAGRKKVGTVQFKTTLSEEKLNTFLKYYPKTDLTKALKKYLDDQIAAAEAKI